MRGAPEVPKLASWNLRWLVDPAAPAAAAKRAVVQNACMGGRVALLQETHWDEATAGVWAGLFPNCQVLSGPARPGPTGGPQGGVAIIVPAGWECTHWEVLVPGCVLQARLRRRAESERGEDFLVQSVYFPPR